MAKKTNETINFMEFLEKDITNNPEPVRRRVSRLKRREVLRSPQEIDRIRGRYVDWLSELKEKYGNKK